MPTRNNILALTALFIASRMAYYAFGVTFDSSLLQSGLQFLDPVLLEDRMVESLVFYHTNPPVLNLFAGAGLKLFGENHDWFFALLFHSLSFLMLFSLLALGHELLDSRFLTWLVVVIVAISPSLILYETWLMYTLPSCALLTTSAWLLLRYLGSNSAAWGFGFFACLALLVLTRALFHFFWLLLVIALLFLYARVDRKQLVRVAALPVLVCLLWYGKNLHLFGNFATSSLAGLSLSNVTTLTLPRELLARHVDAGHLTRFAVISRYRDLPAILDTEVLAPETGIPALDQTRKHNGHLNYNSLEMKLVGQAYLEDALFLMSNYRDHYFVAVSLANSVYFSPGSMSVYFSENNRQATATLRQIYNYLVYGAGAEGRVMQPHFGFSNAWYMPVNQGYTLMTLSFLLLLWGAGSSIATVIKSEWSPRNILVGYIFGNLLLLYLAGTLLELSENNRYRFIGEPLFFFLTALAVTRTLNWFRSLRTGT